jgi:hypothetical protein
LEIDLRGAVDRLSDIQLLVIETKQPLAVLKDFGSR